MSKRLCGHCLIDIVLNSTSLIDVTIVNNEGIPVLRFTDRTLLETQHECEHKECSLHISGKKDAEAAIVVMVRDDRLDRVNNSFLNFIWSVFAVIVPIFLFCFGCCVCQVFASNKRLRRRNRDLEEKVEEFEEEDKEFELRPHSMNLRRRNRRSAFLN